MIDSTYPLEQPHRADPSTTFIVSALVLFVAGLFLTMWWGGTIAYMRLVYPASVFLIGGLLYRAFPVLYIGFTWWVWFLSPMIRRVVDLQAGWADPNPILLAPYLVGGITIFTLARHVGRLREKSAFSFLLVLAGIFLGYLVGVVRVSPFAATFNLLQWIVPVLFGFHVFVSWQSFPQYRRTFTRVFLWGALVMGAYALIQFFFLPSWDAFWMVSSEMDSVGKAKPLEVRVFSTVNAPAPFAYAMIPGMLLIFAGRRLLNFLSAVAGYGGFLLSLVRSAWGGWLVGLIFLTMRTSGKGRSRLITVMLVSGLVAVPLLSTGVILEKVSARFQTFSSIEQDNSLNARLAAYKGVTIRILNDPVGYGMGVSGSASRKVNDKVPVLDSGLLDIALQLGWLGAFLYYWGLARLTLPLIREERLRRDPLAVTFLSIVLAMISLLVFGKTQIGLGGMILWGFLGLAAAGARYYAAEDERKAEAGEADLESHV